MTHEAMRVEQVRTALAWAGQEGFARFRRTGDWAVPDPGGFRADWSAVSLDGIQLAEWRSTAVSGAAPPDPPGSVRLDAIIGGRVHYRFGRIVHAGEPGSVHLMRSGRPVHLSVPGGLRVARVSLRGTGMPVWLRDLSPLDDGPLPVTALTAGFVALLDHLTAAIRDDPGEPPLATAKAVGVLAAALLEEAIPHGGAGTGDLRERIVAYIDRHLGDEDLGPRRIADEFDVSLRWVHRVFNRDDESVARYIRERRVDAIAHRLRSERRRERVADLAFRFGFAGRDQLTRAFRQRYGVTVTEYLDLVVQGNGAPGPVRR